MKTADIYCRVSTEEQEREGSSLQTQLEACLNFCRDKGYEVAHRFSEVFSGLSLERPRLNELRELVRSGETDVIVVYCLDRLSRDPTHGVILTQEMEKHNVTLEAVTETVDGSELGKLISYIRGFASKLEAEKIRERTMRGKKARAQAGRLPSGSHRRLYGYTYLPGKKQGQGIRQVNEDEAKWVREMFRWLVVEQMSTNKIMYRLRDMKAPTPSGNAYWIKRTVQKMIRNPAYCGKTYAFTVTYGEPKKRLKPDSKRAKTGIIRKDSTEWIEIPNATPPIISEATFVAAQEQLERNKDLSNRNVKPASQYLLRGHLRCRRCGRRLWASRKVKTRGNRRYSYPYYTCPRNLKQVSPVKCGQSSISASKVEGPVWERIRALLSDPELVVREVLRSQEQSKDVSHLQRSLDRVEAQLTNRDKQKARAWKAFEITGDEESFKASIANLRKETASLDQERSQLQQRIQATRELQLDPEDIRKFCDLVCGNLKDLDFDSKRLALDALNVTVWLDEGSLSIEGAIPVGVGSVESPLSEWHRPARRPEN